jgi:hypothetical protein
LGARFFDIRLTCKKNKIYTSHKLITHDFDDIIDMFNLFKDKCIIKISIDNNNKNFDIHLLKKYIERFSDNHIYISMLSNISDKLEMIEYKNSFWNSEDCDYITSQIFKISEAQRINLISTAKSKSIIFFYTFILTFLISLLFLFIFIITKSKKIINYIIVILSLISSFIGILNFYEKTPRITSKKILNNLNSKKYKIPNNSIIMVDFLDEKTIKILNNMEK